ncbi:MAG: hypothetical protein MAG458_01710 [Nitrosopumilus sp.]|nr:hypothetical protein [Nitrosopumilus sp.]
MITESKTIDSKAVLEVGPLQSMFPCSTSKIMDFMITFHRYDYSISDIGKHSGITFKTALNEVKKLEEQGVLIRTRNVGKAIMFQFNSESIQAKSLRKLCLDIAKSRIN